MHDDHEGTLRRLTTAAERDPSGKALVEALAPAARGRAARSTRSGSASATGGRASTTPRSPASWCSPSIEAGRPLEAKQHIAALDLYPNQRAVADLKGELARDVAHAEQTIPGT